MPHKKAKQSIREKVRNEIGADLPPQKGSLRSEPIPKSASRILNAQNIRDDFRKKRKSCEERADNEGRVGKRQKKTKSDVKSTVQTTLKIQPGESMQHFNRRVEDDLRPLVKSAMQTARSRERGAAREPSGPVDTRLEKKTEKKRAKYREEEGAKEISLQLPPTHPDRPKEFASVNSSAPKRLNDIAQAPPEFSKLPRGATAFSTKKDGVLSMAQKLLMEKERENAITRYRELKSSRKLRVDTITP
ncbi:hypothetical protein CPB83DRAFT_775925 [Crepidotus variabilis]|uniref:Coiled-coil domain-containing protein 137 n=1 Tax=Crepidotus variabilis TaxID=179855 RepID=A0A9P6JJC3_9AGAR|nr:hypothetical protein CPB83DRAFT_775925 [Crepidotus variabilis]